MTGWWATRALRVWGAMALLGLAAGCGGSREAGMEERAEGPGAGGLELVYVSPEPLGVNPFLRLGQTGVERAAERLGGRARVLESEDPTTREENVRAAVDDGADLVVLLGFEFNDILGRVAPGAPDTDFLVVDQCPPAPPENVYCALFREHEASFLLGALAARLSESRHVGAIGVVDIPFLHRYTDGFAAGARHVDPEIRVSVRWVGGENPFSDPVRAKEQAGILADEGVDQLFAAAAAGNYGIFEAARERQLSIFGLDIDQCPEAPGRVVDNLLKRVDRVIVESVEGIVSGTAPRRAEYGIGSGGLSLVALEMAGEGEAAAELGAACRIRERSELAAEIRALAEQVAAGEVGIDDPMALAAP